MNRLFIVALASFLSLSAWAHGGEDHGSAAAAEPTIAALPRISTATDQFELVGVLEGKVLKLYLDQFGSNAPVAKAQIEIESGPLKAVATEVAPAVYAVPAELLAQPGKHPLAITVQAGENVDLMNATLEIGQPDAAVAHTHFWGEWAVWGAATALLLAAVGLVAIRRRKQSRKH